MIFVTVGGQMAFDRLVSAVDAWAGRTPGADVFAQIGPSDLEPRHVKWVRLLDPGEFRRRIEEAHAVVAHAGMGTILTTLELGKPIVVLPRRGDLQETRNDHQVATAERLRSVGLVHVARDEHEVPRWLDRIGTLEAAEVIRPWASPQLLGALRDFVARSCGGVPAQKEAGA